MRRVVACVGVVAIGVWSSAGCSGSSGGSGFGDDDSGTGQGGDDGGTTSHPDANFTDTGTIGLGDGSQADTGTVTTTTTIYASTDTQLWSMDATTMAVTEIGTYTGMTACGSSSSGDSDITDVAVNSAGDVYVNTECAIYKATVPATPPTSPISVPLTLVTTITGTNKFYALGFAPMGVLGSGEALIGGDSNGELWYIDTSGASATPQDIGGFGSTWELSGDIAFYLQGTTAAGVATLRKKSGGSTANNDVLAGIDVAAMTSNFNAQSHATSLDLGLYGSGTSYGDLFGVGIVGSDVYAFSNAHSTFQAQLIQISGTGAATPIQSFPNITDGWTGAGVTTSVMVTIGMPPNPP